MMSESEVLSFMEEYKKEHSVLIDSYKVHVRKLRADAATHSSAFYTFDENLYVNIFGFAAKIAIYEVDKEDYEGKGEPNWTFGSPFLLPQNYHHFRRSKATLHNNRKKPITEA